MSDGLASKLRLEVLELQRQNRELLAILREIVADSHDIGRVTADTLDRAEAIISRANVR